MKTFSHLWKYLAEFFLGWEMLQIEVVEKIKIHVLCSVAFFRESCRLWDIVETFGGTRGHKWRHNMAHTRCMLDKQDCTQARACTLPHTHTHTHRNIILTAFLRQQSFAPAARCYVIRTLPVLSCFSFTFLAVKCRITPLMSCPLYLVKC